MHIQNVSIVWQMLEEMDSRLCVSCEKANIQYFITSLLTYLLTPWRRVLLKKLTGSAARQ